MSVSDWELKLKSESSGTAAATLVCKAPPVGGWGEGDVPTRQLLVPLVHRRRPTPNHLCKTFFQLVFIDGQLGSRRSPCRDDSRSPSALYPEPALTRQRRGYGQGRLAASKDASPASPTSRGD